MESSSSRAGSLALQAAPMPPNPYAGDHAGGMTLSGRSTSPEHDVPQQHPILGSISEPGRHVDLTQASNVRENGEEQDSLGLDNEAALAANILANSQLYLQNGPSFEKLWDEVDAARKESSSNTLGLIDNKIFDTIVSMEDDEPRKQPPGQIMESDIDPQNAQAYAKLIFPDGDLFITTHDVILGRNMDIHRQLRRRKKQEEKARAELDTYRKEPSQPSQTGDGEEQGNPSSSSQSLEGRPAPPSNFSEHGGSIWYPPANGAEAEHIQRAKIKRRVSYLSKSSSTTSIAPAHLHPNMLPDFSQVSFNADGEPEFRTSAMIPIHTQIPEDISKISKQHLKISFNFQEELWQVTVLGKSAFVNDELVNQNLTKPLSHNDEIMVSSVRMVFKLPENFRHSPGLSRGTFSKDSDDDSDGMETAVSTSPIRRLSNAMDTEDSDDAEDEDIEEPSPLKMHKFSLKIKPSKREKAKSKEKPKKASAKQRTEQSPEASKKAEKGKKRKGGGKEPVGPLKGEKLSATPEAPTIKPGSALEGIPVEHLPEKRKGPGRPPKEGNVSKRDLALATRKRKDYERRGEEPPPFKDLVDLVRRETKQKELQAKVAAGQLPPDTQVAQSIETDATGNSYKTPVVQMSESTNPSTNLPAESAKKASPKPKRTVKSPSPMKPMSDFTEEELKKPTATYLHILDEILNDHPNGRADLQEIYDRIMKRYPYYKYKAETNGWQSSVRHNLLQNKRFMEIGKSGKGKLWAIDFEIPLEKEKKKRVTPPPRPPMPNGHFMPGQMPPYGQPQYPYGSHQHYGQPSGGPQTGPGTYFSPYAQPGQPGHYAAHAQPGASHMSPPNGHNFPPPQNPSGPPQTHQQPPEYAQFGGLIEEIMDYRNRYLGQFHKPVQEVHQKPFAEITTLLSGAYHEYREIPPLRETLRTDEERKVFDNLAAIFKKYPLPKQDPGESDGGTAAGEVQKAVHDENAAASAELQPESLSTESKNPVTVAEPVNIVTSGNADIRKGESQQRPDSSGVKRQADAEDEEEVDSHPKRRRLRDH